MTLFSSLQSLTGSMKSNNAIIANGSSSSNSFGSDESASYSRHWNRCHPCPPVCRPCPPPHCRPHPRPCRY